ncbi:MAG: hypothetical protein Q7R73_02825 [bacterium]|nr:hypothetical protein [bacterium]
MAYHLAFVWLLRYMNRQTIFTIILVIVLAALGALWYVYFSGRSAEDTDGPAGVDVGVYQRVKDLRLDVALFDDPVFRELKQETIPPPVSQSVGRSNPFLPF